MLDKHVFLVSKERQNFSYGKERNFWKNISIFDRYFWLVYHKIYTELNWGLNSNEKIELFQ